MKYAEIRQAFIKFFEEKKHKHVASSSLIPHNDPTIMFTNAGMNQFKDVFLGADKREYNRAVTIQKCLRAGGKHNDLENVGFTARHHTFFEMMGNFSFGDYFKKEAIAFAWEFLTQRLHIPEERLYVTVFETDDEAAEIWHTQMGVPREKIYRYGEKDNFWRMGQTGPCGPCSEIFYDHYPSRPPVPLHEDEGRYVEIWNLVFMQFFEDESGKQTPLPKPSVDTGAGLERIAAALQGFTDNYQCDAFQPLIATTCKLSGLPDDWQKIAKNPQTLGAVKVVADHARACTFLIGEGVLPSNEGRGYVLRRIMRRAIRYGRQLTEKSMFPSVCEQVIQSMAPYYPNLKERADFILTTVIDEEKRFLQTLDKGSDILLNKLKELKKTQQTQLDGFTAFTLYDTFGFPFDLTQLIAKEQGLTVDEKAFEKAMESAKEKARKAHKSQSITSNEKHLADWTAHLAQKFGVTEFVGYDHLKFDSELIALSNGTEAVDTLAESGWVVLRGTPFYAEGGGQDGDVGIIVNPSTEATLGYVRDCKKLNNVYLHYVEVSGAPLTLGKTYGLRVNTRERQATANNHSATHLLNAALSRVLGSHVHQAGSLVNANKLRFDFSHNQGVTASELEQIEKIVNDQISLAAAVTKAVMPHKEAVALGAVAMFGEKYGSEVRVITMGHDQQKHFSMELCGGTHVENTAQIRLFKIVSETGISAGVRRIEALTGDRAFQYLNELAEENKRFRQHFKLPNPKVDDSVFAGFEAGQPLLDVTAQLQDKVQNLEKENKKLKSQSVSLESILSEAEQREHQGENLTVLMTRVDISDRELLSSVVDQIREKPNVALALIGESEGNTPKPMIVAFSKNLKKFHAGKITQELCVLLEGKGGGRPDFAQGSVSNLDKLNQAKKRFYELLG